MKPKLSSLIRSQLATIISYGIGCVGWLTYRRMIGNVGLTSSRFSNLIISTPHKCSLICLESSKRLLSTWLLLDTNVPPGMILARWSAFIQISHPDSNKQLHDWLMSLGIYSPPQQAPEKGNGNYI